MEKIRLDLDIQVIEGFKERGKENNFEWSKDAEGKSGVIQFCWDRMFIQGSWKKIEKKDARLGTPYSTWYDKWCHISSWDTEEAFFLYLKVLVVQEW